MDIDSFIQHFDQMNVVNIEKQIQMSIYENILLAKAS